MNPTEPLLFIGKCLALDNHPEMRGEVTAMITARVIPWEEFVWTGSSHYVLPALYSAFRRNGLLPLLPEDLSMHLEHIYSLNFRRNLGILDQCREIGTFLNHKGIELLFLKGAGILLSGIYNDLGDRIMEDIDILIPEKDLQKATEYLSILGYLPPEIDPGGKVYEDHHHLPPIVCKEKAAPVEIHRFPVNMKYYNRISIQSIFKDGVQSKELSCRLPSVKDRQLIIFFHELLSSDGYLSATPSIKGMYDFYLLAKQYPPDPLYIPKGRYRESFRRFIYIMGKYLNDPERFGCIETQALMRLWKREVFLLNHPWVNRFWHDYVYTTFYLGGLLIKSLYSEKSRKLILFKLKKLIRSK
jgi:hypothetical protein